jgi:hypothetical protein
MTRYKVQQFDWGFRTYDTQTEEPVEGAIAEFDITDEQADLIAQKGTTIEVVDDNLVITEGKADPILPYVEEQYAEQQRKADEYAEFLASPAGRAAQRYVFYMNNGYWPEDEANQ